jgi:hypothetical protein
MRGAPRLEVFSLLKPINPNHSTNQSDVPAWVIAAQAAILAAYPSSGDNHGLLDSRLHGNDEKTKGIWLTCALDSRLRVNDEGKVAA